MVLMLAALMLPEVLLLRVLRTEASILDSVRVIASLPRLLISEFGAE